MKSAKVVPDANVRAACEAAHNAFRTAALAECRETTPNIDKIAFLVGEARRVLKLAEEIERRFSGTEPEWIEPRY